MDSIDRAILNILQFDFPLTTRPFAAIARTSGISESDVLERIGALKQKGIIRQISAIFDSASIGYQSTLVAFRVPPKRLGEVAASISALAGVSHNYRREGRYNLWFTLTVPAKRDLQAEAVHLARCEQIADWLFLPALHTFKIGFRLDLSGDEGPHETAVVRKRTVNRRRRIPEEFIRHLQRDLPLRPRPFCAAARALHLTEGEIIARCTRYMESGAIRRIAAVLRQKKAGFAANVMVAWAPAAARKEALAACAVREKWVSHCYERPSSKKWPFSLYTMIHGRTMAACRKTIRAIEKTSGVKRYRELKTLKEFKKIRVEYYPESSPAGGPKIYSPQRYRFEGNAGQR